MTDKNHLQIVVHDNGQVTTRDERGMPVLCKDCRFSGWLTEFGFRRSGGLPTHCLFYSGGAEPTNGTRVIRADLTSNYPDPHPSWVDRYPKLRDKNHDGMCTDFVPAQPLPWWKRWFRSIRKIRS